MAPIARSFAEPLMIDLTCVPATQNPSSPRMVCHDHDGSRDSSN